METRVPHNPLSVRHVCKRFGSIIANDDLSFDIAPGSITGLLGPNGAGKTTLIRICAGLLRPDTGVVLINGFPQSQNRLRAKAFLGLVSRDIPFHHLLTVEEILRLQATLYGLAGSELTEACDRALEEYCLSSFARRRIGVLSSGMLQRVAIACAMLHNPPVLLLDEPTAGLDPEVRQHIWECLLRLKQQQVAMLLTTHYLEEAARLCEDIHLLVNGKTCASMQAGDSGHSARSLEQQYLAACAHEPSAPVMP